MKNNLLNFRTCFKTWFFSKFAHNSLYLGAIRAYIIPTLPVRVESYYNHIFVKIFRVIGGMSFFMVVTEFYIQLPQILQWFFAIIASIHLTQVFIVLIIEIFYSLYNLIYKRGKFDVRISPLNINASIISKGKATYCLKYGFGAGGAAASLTNFKYMYLKSKSIQGDTTSSSISSSKGSVSIKVSKININWNCYTKKNYNSNTNLWTNTRPLYIEILSNSLTNYNAKNIIKYNLSKGLQVYNPKPKYIIKYKYIIKFISLSNPESKLTLDLCNAKEHKLNDSKGYANNNRGDTTTTIPCVSSGWLRWIGGRLAATLLSIQTGSVSLRGVEQSNSSINILLIVGIVLSIFAPSFIDTLTGVNIYDQSSITDSIYSLSLIKIRMCCATVFLHLLIYFYVLNQNRIKQLKQYIFNKHVMWASCLIVKGGLDGLGEQEIEEQHETPKPMPTVNSSKITDLGEELPLTLSATQIESKSKDNSVSFPRLNHELNDELNDIPDTDTPESSNALPFTESSTSSGYPFWPRPAPACNVSIQPGSNSEPAPTSEGKKVRINEYTEVQEISGSAAPSLDKTREKRYEIIQLDPKKKLQKHRPVETDNNINENSDTSNSNNLNFFKGKQISSKNKKDVDWISVLIWEKKYPKNEAELENWPEIEVVNPLSDKCKKYKSSGSLASSNLENINGQISNPSSTSNRDARSMLQDVQD